MQFFTILNILKFNILFYDIKFISFEYDLRHMFQYCVTYFNKLYPIKNKPPTNFISLYTHMILPAGIYMVTRSQWVI